MKEVRLKRKLGFYDVYCISTGAMVSSGLFVLPGIAHAKAGPAVAVSYLLAGALALTGVLSQSELVSAMPRTGGSYFYITRSLGSALGTSAGIMLWLSVMLKTSFALVGMGAFANYLFPGFPIRTFALIFAILFIILNIKGIKQAAKFEVIVVTALIVTFVFYIFKGLPSISEDKLLPFVPYGWNSVLVTAGLVFVSYGGVLKAASIAEEVKKPHINIPKAMIVSLVTMMLVYFVVVFITAGVLDAEVLDASLTPISDAAKAFAGKFGAIVMTFGAMLAFISTANAGIMAAARYPVAMARDRLMPGWFSRISPKTNTPSISILITGLVIVAALFLPLVELVEMASTVMILTFILDIISMIIMRESRLQNYQPTFRAPLYPFLQIIGILGLMFLITDMGYLSLFLSALLIVIGLLWYWFYGRVKIAREYALSFLISRITTSQLKGNLLETELREIIRERDGITRDTIDTLIEEAPLLDFEGEISATELFRRASEIFSEMYSEPESSILKKFLSREVESTTVIGPNLAIPHIIVEGEGKLAMVIARSKGGIFFPSADYPVYACFLLAGSKDTRNLYLKTLAAIAEMTGKKEFERRWLSAKDETALKNILLLSKRRRYGTN